MSDEKAIVPAQPRQLLSTFNDVERAAAAMSASGFFQDSRNAAQAIVKILAGSELGFGPFASMKGVYIIQGGPSFSANMIAAAVKKSGRYNYRLHQGHPTASECSIDFFENLGGKWELVGTSTFTLEDARKAQTKNLDKFPRNMLFARAMSNGVKWYCPDVFNGTPVYTPEELGAEVDQEGNVINGQFKTLDQPPAPAGMVDTAQELGATVTEQPAPVNGNGKSSRKTQLIAHLRNVEAEAENYGIVFDLITDEELNEATEAEIIQRGKGLRAEIDAKKKS